MIRFEKIRTLESQDFGTIRYVISQGEPWFIASDVAQALWIKRHRDALYRHVPKEFRKIISIHQTEGGTTRCAVLDVRGVYTLAERVRYKYRGEYFTEWFTEHGLPKLQVTQDWLKVLCSCTSKLSNSRDTALELADLYENDACNLHSAYLKCKKRAEDAEKQLATVLSVLKILVNTDQSAALTQLATITDTASRNGRRTGGGGASRN